MSQQLTPDALDKLTLTGSPHARGVKHGEEYAEDIKDNLETYLARFDYHGADEESVYEQAEEFNSIINEENEEYATEMQGIAEGSGLSISDITILNARSEIMYGAFKAEADELRETEPDGCTAFGARPEITSDGHTYIGQNWDWMPPLNIFVMDIQRDDKPNMVALTEAGIVGGKIGINEQGLGILYNGLVTANDGKHPFRKPYHVRFREMLDADRFDKAAEPLVTKERACSASITLGHAEGEMMNFELAPEASNYVSPKDHLLTHTNHLEEHSDIESEFEKLLPDTLCRGPRIRRLFSRESPNIDAEVAQEVFQDHFGKPASICRHPDESEPKLDRLQSNGSFVLDLSEQKMYATNGPPCENEYNEYEVAS